MLEPSGVDRFGFVTLVNMFSFQGGVVPVSRRPVLHRSSLKSFKSFKRQRQAAPSPSTPSSPAHSLLQQSAQASLWLKAPSLASSSGLLEDFSDQLLSCVDDGVRILRAALSRFHSVVARVVLRQHAPPRLELLCMTPRIPRGLSVRLSATPQVTSADFEFAHSATCCLIASAGYPVELHYTTTIDGYVLPVIRIPRRDARRCVFLQHGLLDSPAAWVSSGRIVSLAFRAYQAGFDVFLGAYPCGVLLLPCPLLAPATALFCLHRYIPRHKR
jgi:hypothetical protein